MTGYDMAFAMEQMLKKMDALTQEISELKSDRKTEELCDNADMIRIMKVSERTLASWRSKGKIGFVQIGSKIYYTDEQRSRFLTNHSTNPKNA